MRFQGTNRACRPPSARRSLNSAVFAFSASLERACIALSCLPVASTMGMARLSATLSSANHVFQNVIGTSYIKTKTAAIRGRFCLKKLSALFLRRLLLCCLSLFCHRLCKLFVVSSTRTHQMFLQCVLIIIAPKCAHCVHFQRTCG